MSVSKLLIFLLLFFATTHPALAIVDPLSVPNNKIGIHLLFPDEVSKANDLVNNFGTGSWGYVTIPIQSSDRNHTKWQKFLNDCLNAKLIPIIRVATVASGSNWEEPNNYDLIDFANFLNDLSWPTKNRYIIIFNEVNRPDEYGGEANPEKYSEILDNAINVFKERSADFFVLPAGLDNAAITKNGAVHWSQYLSRMETHKPGIFDKIDGWTSHAYPNPDFSSRPDISGSNKIDSFISDINFLKKFTSKTLPVFITETGWSNRYLTDAQIAYYYQYALSKPWSHPQVVAITPFLINAQEGPFREFSFTDSDGSFREFAKTWSLASVIGQPELNTPKSPLLALQTPTASTSPQVLGISTDPYDFFKRIYNNLQTIFNLLH